MVNIVPDILTRLKTESMARGSAITPLAAMALSQNGRLPLSIHEYATTGGITFAVEDVYINAPFDEWYCQSPAAVLGFSENDGFSVTFEGERFSARALPLPRYLDATDSQGNAVRDVVMTHADRVRLSPIDGCAMRCQFCDMAAKRYRARPLKQLLEALDAAVGDENLPARHVLLSGGTPGRKHRGYFDETFDGIIAAARLPVDVMMTPREEPGPIEQLARQGVRGFALNIEIFDRELARRIVPQKAALGLDAFRASIEVAVGLLGRGRVRSLLVVGLEPLESTLQGVDWLASLGCDPVLSPFRPAEGTPLSRTVPPSAEFLTKVLSEATDIVEKHGVKLGPRCIPCQHNTLTFPDGTEAYHYS